MKILFAVIIINLFFTSCKKDDEIYTIKNASVIVQPITDIIFTLNVFPNPCISFINLQLKFPRASSLKISIYNLMGRMVYQSTTTIMLSAGLSTIGVDVQSLQSGIYFLKCEFDSGSITKKIVKN